MNTNTLEGYASSFNYRLILVIDFRTGEVTVNKRHGSQNGTSFHVYHGHSSEFRLPGGYLSEDALEEFRASTEGVRGAIVDSYESTWDGRNHIGTIGEGLLEDFERRVERLEVEPVWEISEYLEAGMNYRRPGVLFSVDGCRTKIHPDHAGTARGRRRIRALVREIEALVASDTEHLVEGDPETYVIRELRNRR